MNGRIGQDCLLHCWAYVVFKVYRHQDVNVCAVYDEVCSAFTGAALLCFALRSFVLLTVFDRVLQEDMVLQFVRNSTFIQVGEMVRLDDMAELAWAFELVVGKSIDF